MSQSGSRERATCSTIRSSRLTPRLIFGAITMAVCLAGAEARDLRRLRGRWCRRYEPSVFLARQLGMMQGRGVGLVNSSTASAASNKSPGSSADRYAQGSMPARAPTSRPMADEPARSTPPTTRQRSFAAAARTSIWPMRPAQPTTPMRSADFSRLLSGVGRGMAGAAVLPPEALARDGFVLEVFAMGPCRCFAAVWGGAWRWTTENCPARSRAREAPTPSGLPRTPSPWRRSLRIAGCGSCPCRRPRTAQQLLLLLGQVDRRLDRQLDIHVAARGRAQHASCPCRAGGTAAPVWVPAGIVHLRPAAVDGRHLDLRRRARPWSSGSARGNGDRLPSRWKMRVRRRCERKM